MAVNTTIASLSQTASLNGPDGATDGPNTADDALRYHGAFIAQLRDGAGYTAGAIVAALGYTPVRNGDITGAGTSLVRVGWNSAISRLVCQVDDNSFSNTWPINITGSSPWSGITGKPTTVAGYGISDMGSQSVNYANSAGTAGSATTAGSASLAANSLGLGGLPPANWLQNNGSSLTYIRNAGSSQLVGQITGVGEVSWNVFVSDPTIKTDVADSHADSLGQILRISWKQFRYTPESMVDDGRLHELGAMADQMHALNPDWVNDAGTWLALNPGPMALSAMHAIAQLHTQVQELRAEVQELRALVKG